MNLSKLKYWTQFPKLNWSGYKKDKVWGPLLVSWDKSSSRVLLLSVKSVREDTSFSSDSVIKRAIVIFQITLWRGTFMVMLPRPLGLLKNRVPQEYSISFDHVNCHINWPKKGYSEQTHPDDYSLGDDRNYIIYEYFWKKTTGYEDHYYNIRGSVACHVCQDDQPLKIRSDGIKRTIRVMFGVGQDMFDGEWIPFAFIAKKNVWHRGDDRWLRWMRWVFKPIVQKYIDFWFVKEVGTKKGSWKGGTVGCSMRFTNYDESGDIDMDLSATHIHQTDEKDKLSHLKLHKHYRSLVRGLLKNQRYLDNVHFIGHHDINTNEFRYVLSNQELWLEAMATYENLIKAPVAAQEAVKNTFIERKKAWEKRDAERGQTEVGHGLVHTES